MRMPWNRTESKAKALASLRRDPDSKMQRDHPGPSRATTTACPHGDVPVACPLCRRRLERLGLAVVQGHEDEISCAQFLSVVAVAGAGLLRDDGIGGDPLLAGHAVRCASCAADLAAARDTLASLTDAQAPLPPRVPDPDLTFLRSTPAAPAALDPKRLATRLALAALALLLAWRGWARLAERATGEADLGAAAPIGQRRSDIDRRAPSGSATLTTPVLTVTPAVAAGALADRWLSATAVAGRGDAPRGPALRGVATAAAASGAVSSALASSAPSATPTMAPPAPEPATEEPNSPEPTDPPTSLPPEPAAVTCALHAFGPQAGLFKTGCGPFRSAAAFDLYQVTVSQPGRFTFDTCEGAGGLDSLLVLYPADGFDPMAPCRGILAADDDGCGTLSRLTLDLGVGRYLLLVSEQTGDLSDHYRLGVEAPAGNDACPRIAPGTTPVANPSPSPALPTATSAAGALLPPLATPAASPQPLPIEPGPVDPPGTPPALP